MPERHGVVLEWDTRTFESGLAKSRSGVGGLVAPLVASGGAMDRLQGASTKAGRGLQAASASVSSFVSILGPAAGATGKVGTALGAVAGTMFSGGPFGLALAGAVVGIGLITTKMGENKKEAAAWGEELKRISVEGIDKAKESTKALADEIRNFGMDALAVQSRDIFDDADRTAALLKGIEGQRIRASRAIFAERELLAKRNKTESEHLTQQTRLLETLNAQHANLKAQSVESREQIDLVVKRNEQEGRARVEREAERQAEDAKRRAEREHEEWRARLAKADGTDAPSEMDQMMGASAHVIRRVQVANKKAADDEMAQLRAVLDDAAKSREAHREESEKAEAAHQDRIFKLMAETNRKAAALAESQAAAQAAAWQKSWDVMAQAGQAALNNGLGAFQGYLEGVITGQEKAAEKATAAFLQQTGGQLVGLGTKAVWEGGMMVAASHGLDPAGYTLMGLGAGAILAGVGMGAAGVAVGHIAAGGTIGQALPSDGGSAPSGGPSTVGAPSGGSTAATMQGGQQVTIYEFHAPVFGDHNQSARHVGDLYERNQRDLLGGRRR